MIFYLSSPENRDDFDFLRDFDDEFIVDYGEFDLKERLLKRGGGFERCRVVIIDIAAASGKTRNIPEMLESFRKMYPTKTVCYNKGGHVSEEIVVRLIDAGFYNVITADTPEGIAREWSECLRGRSEQEARTGSAEEHREDIRSRRIYHCREVFIGVFGSEPRSGATYTATGLVNYLTGCGVSAHYVESNIAYTDSRLEYIPDVISKSYGNGRRDANVNVVNFGSMLTLNPNSMKWATNANKLNMVSRAKFDRFLLVSGWQPWQDDTLSKTVFALTRMGLSVDLVLPFVPERLRPDLIAKHQSKTVRVLFAEYAPDLCDSSPNERLYEAVMEDWEAR